jgi:hypothetical protein
MNVIAAVSLILHKDKYTFMRKGVKHSEELNYSKGKQI